MTRLIVISSEHEIKSEELLVNTLFEQGMELFHIRKPTWSIEKTHDFIKGINPAFHNRLSLHHHHKLVKLMGLEHMHFRKTDRDYFTAYLSAEENKKNSFTISSSFYDYDDVAQFENNVSYGFLSPVFNSVSKKGYMSRINPKFMVPVNCKTKLFALGGVTIDTIQQVFERNFYGAAVLGAIWNEPEKAVENFIALNSLVKQ